MTKKQMRVLWIIFWISLISTLGSLYIEHFGDPVMNLTSGDFWNQSMGIAACNLCWYIRVFTYPLVVISLVWIIRKHPHVVHSIFRLSLICFGFCVYKYGLEMHWRVNGGNPFLCVTWSVDCAEAKPLYFGFITLALMGVFTNSIIMVLCYLVDKKYHTEELPLIPN